MWNRPMVLEVSIVQPSRRKLGIVAQEGGEGEGWQYFYLGLGPEYKGMPTLWKYIKLYILIYVLFLYLYYASVKGLLNKSVQ